MSLKTDNCQKSKKIQVQFTVILNIVATNNYNVIKNQIMRHERHWFDHQFSQSFRRVFKFS